MPNLTTDTKTLHSICQLCGREGDMPLLYPAWRIVRCDGCGLAFFPENVETAELYTEKYFSGQEYRDYLADETALRKNFRERLADVRKLKPSGRLLELGCAYGLFLDEARTHFDVRGMDICEKPLQHAREKLKLDVTYGDFLAAPDEPAGYDAICMWDTIEHLPRPVAFIEKAARWLRPGGILVMTTGDIASLVARVRGPKWRLVHPPTHLFYFSPRTLGRAATRAGLETVQVKHPPYYRSYKSIAYGLFMAKAKPSPTLYKLMTLGDKLDFNIPLNLYDVMMLVARKP